jgi:hypothetical protein
VKFLAEKKSSMKWNYLELEHCGLSQLQLVRQAPWASAHRSVPYLEMARQEQGEESVVTTSASVWSLTVLCMREREMWSAREGSQRMEVVTVVMCKGCCRIYINWLSVTHGVWWSCRPPKSLLHCQLQVCTCHVTIGLLDPSDCTVTTTNGHCSNGKVPVAAILSL